MSSNKLGNFFYFNPCNKAKKQVKLNFLYYLRGVLMEENFNKHLGNKLKLRRLALGLTQTKVAKAINVTFQQIQKYEKGTNGVSSIRLLQLSNYLKIPINYFYEDFSDYLINQEKSKERHMNVNYNFLVKMFSELTDEQKIKLEKNLRVINTVARTG
jgi:transcriptional regulator with XRE-family HTH domain